LQKYGLGLRNDYALYADPAASRMVHHGAHAMIITAPIRSEGAGAQVRRPFPSPELRWPATDPFLLFDEFFVAMHAGFPDHPHRGFEIITYILDGGFEHRDSLGNDVHALAGHAMHFVTGSGVIHSEMPIGSAHGIQLWINLPRALKSVAPSLELVTPQQIPVLTFDGGTACRLASPSGPIVLKAGVIYDDVRFERKGTWSVNLPDDWVGIAYVLEGTLEINGASAEAGQLALIEHGQMELAASAQARAIVLQGKRQHESVRFVGPFVD
jgi:redox-sensitive bicupin YhaK (pirin superfamily)